jgi:hypothetical protein
MSFDSSRFTFNPWNDFLGVAMQQGRVQLDSDWNEWLTAFARRMQADSMDTMGRAAVPATTPNGFRIGAAIIGGVQHVTIGAGRMYVDGLMVENHGPAASAQWDAALAELSGEPAAPPTVAEIDLDYTAQPYLPNASLPQDPGPFLAYVDVWKRPVTYLEYPDLIDAAVGVDTTGRVQMVWQVKLLDVSQITGVTCATPDGSIPAWESLIQPSGAQLTTAVVPSATSGPCCLNTATGYTGMENQLYRVEIHQGGVANSSGTSSPVAATFKWSRENASVITAVTAIGPATNVANNPTSQLTVQGTGRDNVLAFEPGDWIEITDDFLELNGQAGELHQIDSNGVSKAQKTIRLQTPVSPEFLTRLTSGTDYHTRICRWDQNGKVYQSDGVTVWVDLDAAGSTGQIPVPPPGTSLVLESGVTITFSLNAALGNFQVGDFWAFAARASDGTVQIITQAPPMGVHHHYARLSIVTFPTTATECRTIWPPTASTAADCACTVCVDAADHNSGKGTIAMAVEKIRSLGGGRVCLGPGIFVLRSTLQLEGLESVMLSGQGPATMLVFAGDGAAITAQNDLGLQIEDLSVYAIATAPLSDVNEGSAIAIGIALRNCIEVAIERCAVYAIPATASSTSPSTIAVALEGFLLETLIRDNLLSADVGIGEPSLIGSTEERTVTALADLDVIDNFLPCNLAGAALGELGAASENPQLNMFLLETAFRANRMIGCSQVGIGIEGVSLPDAAIRIADNHLDVSGIGIACAADGAEIADNLITQAMSAAVLNAAGGVAPTVMGVSITSVPGGQLPITEVRVLRNRINSYAGAGISVNGLVLVSSITGNSVMNVTGAGITVTGPGAAVSSDAMVRDNEVFSVVAPPPPPAAAVMEFGAQTSGANLGAQLPVSIAPAPAEASGAETGGANLSVRSTFSVKAAAPEVTKLFGIQITGTTTASVENNTVALVGATPANTAGYMIASGIFVSNAATTLITGNDVTDIGTDPSVTVSAGVVAGNSSVITVSNNTIQQATPALTQPATFLALDIEGVIVSGQSGFAGQAIVSGNQIAGTSAAGYLVGILIADCVFSANFCRQSANSKEKGFLQTAVVSTYGNTAIASDNRIISASREQLAIDIESASTGGIASATVLGNITSGPIHLNGSPLPTPWAPLNVNAP